MQTHVWSSLRTTPRTAVRKIGLPIAILLACFVAVGFRLENFNFASLALALGSISPTAWAISLAATIASFLAVARYDVMFHGWLATGVAPSRAAITGAASIALSQFLGFGLFTGTLCRWRMLPDISLTKAASITGYVSVAFMLSLGLLTIATLLFSGPLISGTVAFSALSAVAAVGCGYLSLRQPAWLPCAIPPIPLLARIVAATSIDVAVAALAFWILLPGDIGVSLPMVLTVFLLSLGAGLMSGTPFGLGPFEICMLTLLPQVPTADMLAAILGYRLVFFAIPACFAIVVLAWPPKASIQSEAARMRPPTSNLKADAGFAAISDAHSITRLARSTCLTAR
jgi:phosphatidylglycerol lysyltransferase